jgi:hypothetical protein
MFIILGSGILLCLVMLYALCRVSGEADRRLEELSLQNDTSRGGE